MLHLDGNRRLLLYTRAGGAEGGEAAWKNGVRLKGLRFEEKGKDGIRMKESISSRHDELTDTWQV